MEEIFETLREQIKGDFDQNNIIIIFEYFHRVQIYLDILIQVQWIKMSLNLKCYFIRQFIQQKLLELNEHITRYEIITGRPLTKEYIRFFNEPKKQYELTIKNYLQWKI